MAQPMDETWLGSSRMAMAVILGVSFQSFLYQPAAWLKSRERALTHLADACGLGLPLVDSSILAEYSNPYGLLGFNKTSGRCRTE